MKLAALALGCLALASDGGAKDEIARRGDWAEAEAEHRASGRPLFVTLRRLPCKHCSTFDAVDVSDFLLAL